MSAVRTAKKAGKVKTRRRRGNWLFIEHGDSAGECFSKLFTQFAVLVLIACGVIFFNEMRISLSTKKLSGDLKELYHTYLPAVPETAVGVSLPEKIFGIDTPAESSPELLPLAEQLLAINRDTVGYVSIDGTNVSMPVVQKLTADGNAYYLTTAFDGTDSKAGTVFLDYRAKLTDSERSDILTIYGHNQRDGTMFGELKNYKKNVDFYKEHPSIVFSSNYRTDVYKIFAYFVTEVEPSQTRDGNVFYYHNYIDLDESTYNEYISEIMLRSQINTQVDVKYGDQFLVLSTCSNEFEPSRFVVFARRTREGESISVDTSEVSLNTAAKEPDWSVIYKK